jgi:hypothetical protein
MRKRYWLFEVIDYYPSGGLNDVVFKFDTKEELIEYIQDGYSADEDQILDLDTGIDILANETIWSKEDFLEFAKTYNFE